MSGSRSRLKSFWNVLDDDDDDDTGGLRGDDWWTVEARSRGLQLFEQNKNQQHICKWWYVCKLHCEALKVMTGG